MVGMFSRVVAQSMLILAVQAGCHDLRNEQSELPTPAFGERWVAGALITPGPRIPKNVDLRKRQQDAVGFIGYASVSGSCKTTHFFILFLSLSLSLLLS
jgi:hypothetical protein